jgi:hypothetical protein
LVPGAEPTYRKSFRNGWIGIFSKWPVLCLRLREIVVPQFFRFWHLPNVLQRLSFLKKGKFYSKQHLLACFFY